MAIFRCKMCGGDLEVNEGVNVLECEYCGTSQTVPTADNEKKVNLFNRANRLRMSNEFDKAAGVYESIAAEFPEEAEAYWGLCLCKYGIEYVDDPATAKKIPTCHRTSFDSIFNDSNFELAQEYSDAVAVNIYRNEAKEIDRIQKSILEIANKEEPFDIFICYKETAEDGQRTKDSVLAQDIYDALTTKGYKVFFSRITLEDKLGQQYEPYIFSALNSAKIMLAIGTKFEYYNAVWVKNEWGRYLDLMKKDKEKVLIPCYADIDAYDMPQEFQNLQGQDMGKVGFIQDLVRGIGKIIPLESETQNVQVVQQVVAAPSSNIENLLKRGNLALEDKKWDEAVSYFDRVLDENVEEPRAHFGKLLAEYKCSSEKELIILSSTDRLKNSDNYKKAYRFGDDDFKRTLENYANQINYNYANKMYNSNNVSSIAKAVEIFTSIIDFKDSSDLIGKCKEKIYGIALEHMTSAKTEQECLTAKSEFELISGYSDADSKAAECSAKVNEVNNAIKIVQQSGIHTISHGAGSDMVAIKSNGTIVTNAKKYEDKEYDLTVVSNWGNIVSIAAGSSLFVGVKSDGTVISTGTRYNVSGWRNIVSVSAGTNHVVGVKSDGTVVAALKTLRVGEREYDRGQCNVSDWKDIVAVSAGSCHTVGLKSDGTVVATGENNQGQCNVSDWKDIVAVAAGVQHTVGLKSDGTVVVVGIDDSEQCEVSKLTNIVAITATTAFTAALKADGKVSVILHKDNSPLAAMLNITVNDNFPNPPAMWSDVVAIYAGGFNTLLGIKADGSVISNMSASPLFYDVKININPKLDKSIRDKAADKTNKFDPEAQKRAWRNSEVCQHCGGSFKSSLFSKKCSICGRPKDY